MAGDCVGLEIGAGLLAGSGTAPAADGSRRGAKHFIVLDGFRGIAALAVVAMHAGDQFGLSFAPRHAYLAVPFFFMLSGFVIGHAYEDGIMRTRSVASFARVRIERLYPMLIVSLVVALAIALGFHHRSAVDASLLAVAAIAMVPVPGANAFPLIPTQWSLSVEIYGNLIHRAVVGRLTTPRLVGLLVMALALMFIVAWADGGLAGGWRLATLGQAGATFVFCYGLGVLIYRQHRHGTLPRWRLPFGVIVVLLVTTFLLPVKLETRANVAADLACATLVYPLIIISSLSLGESRWIAAVMNALGRLSYPLYILHYPLVLLAGDLARDPLAGSRLAQYGAAATMVFACTALAWLVLVWIDEPWRRAVRGRRRAGAKLRASKACD